MAHRALQPVFFSTPIALGGLGLDPSEIGTITSFFGILSGAITVFFFPRMMDYLGAKGLYLLGITAAVPCFSLYPIINHLARNSIERSGGLEIEVWVAVGLQVIMSVLVCMCYGTSVSKRLNDLRIDPHRSPIAGAVFIFIAAAAPNKASQGATNGLAQLSTSVVRAIGPALVNSIYSLSIDKDHHYMNGGLVYYVTVALSLGAIWVGSLLPKHPWKGTKGTN
jgi:MFS family permease